MMCDNSKVEAKAFFTGPLLDRVLQLCTEFNIKTRQRSGFFRFMRDILVNELPTTYISKLCNGLYSDVVSDFGTLDDLLPYPELAAKYKQGEYDHWRVTDDGIDWNKLVRNKSTEAVSVDQWISLIEQHKEDIDQFLYAYIVMLQVPERRVVQWCHENGADMTIKDCDDHNLVMLLNSKISAIDEEGLMQMACPDKGGDDHVLKQQMMLHHARYTSRWKPGDAETIMDTMKYLIETGKISMDQEDDVSRQMLHHLIQSPRTTDVAELAITKAGADVNKRTECGFAYCPLVVAVEHGNLPGVKLLVKHGVDASVQLPRGHHRAGDTILHLAMTRVKGDPSWDLTAYPSVLKYKYSLVDNQEMVDYIIGIAPELQQVCNAKGMTPTQYRDHMREEIETDQGNRHRW
jgi:hypothetical protein